MMKNFIDSFPCKESYSTQHQQGHYARFGVQGNAHPSMPYLSFSHASFALNPAHTLESLLVNLSCGQKSPQNTTQS